MHDETASEELRRTIQMRLPLNGMGGPRGKMIPGDVALERVW